MTYRVIHYSEYYLHGFSVVEIFRNRRKAEAYKNQYFKGELVEILDNDRFHEMLKAKSIPSQSKRFI